MFCFARSARFGQWRRNRYIDSGSGSVAEIERNGMTFNGLLLRTSFFSLLHEEEGFAGLLKQAQATSWSSVGHQQYTTISSTQTKRSVLR